MLASTLTAKGQTTIPLEVRKALNLKKGDILSFKVNDLKVTITKLEPLDEEYHNALSSTLSEWNSKGDNDAYKNI